ncbi:cytochrome c3 family protein [uncultured Paracoccus sp.]|uniref:cytochrome c3 family protein n=1 Tax=uncultured Paracoccus sp. TaxID=189685 RepID=UPI00260AE71A|nr:cytochrome c3 family protein [uncultured Paracoccus sp.]
MRARFRILRATTIALASLLIVGALPGHAQDGAGQGDGTLQPGEMIPAGQIPFYHDWAQSPHAKADARAFTNWYEEGEIPEDCARCHSTPGFVDYIGADGSTAGVVDRKAPTGTLITCAACHSETARAITAVTFPSGLRVEGLGSEARCMTCHQGRSSTFDVDDATIGIGDDTVGPELEFINIHYRAAGATLMGTLAGGGYEYASKSYTSQRRHPAPFNTCISCHELHTVAPKVTPCAACHEGVSGRESLALIRKSKADHDGDGDVTEGIAAEIEHLHQRLLAAIQAYGRDIAGTPIVYDAHAYPYFFIDLNGNGTAEEDEAKVPNKYASWTPRLLRAAYNYQFAAKDPGAYAHNAPYVLQLLHDSLTDLPGTDLGGASRP